MAKTVLIVDDSKTAQMLVRTTLSRLPGLSLREADNGQLALNLLEKEPVDLIVTDLNMPEMDGIELVRQVRARDDWQKTRIVIVTAKGEESARAEGLRLGADACLLKPLASGELIGVARKLLS